ncbi:protocatechuate 3,4-dioxygenase subunit beta, partial [Streptomyces sp. NPDC007162]
MTLTQADIDLEIAAEHAAYEKRVAEGAPVEHHPRRDYAPYRSSLLRHPKQPLVAIDTSKDPELVELHSPAFGERD